MGQGAGGATPPLTTAVLGAHKNAQIYVNKLTETRILPSATNHESVYHLPIYVLHWGTT